MLKWLIGALIAGWLAQQGAIVGMLVQPWAPWWFSGQTGQVAATPPDVPMPVPKPGELNPHPGFVTDAQRYQLARAVGWSAADAVTATAISLAEDGSGDPAILSGVNRNGTRDLGLWQINSQWWAQFDGPGALIVPLANARAAIFIFGRQGWCAWSTYGPCPTHACGPPCYTSFLDRAANAATAPQPPGQA